MKILLVGDYSNCFACLGDGLRCLGHDVVVASDGSKWLDTKRNFDFTRPLPGPFGGAILYYRLLTTNKLSGFDIVVLVNPSFVKLRPNRQKIIFDKLKRENGSIFLYAAGTDKAFMDMINASDCPLRYSEFYNEDGSKNPYNLDLLEKEKLWQKGGTAEICEYVYDNVNGVTTALYEYHLAMQRRIEASRLSYVGIPIDTKKILPNDKPLISDGKLNIFLGRQRGRFAEKGTDRLCFAAQKVVDLYPDKCKLTIVENLPYNLYVEKLYEADVVLDQIYSFTPATNALMAMAAGKAVVSGAEPEYYDFIGEIENRPIFNALPDDNELFDLLSYMVNNPDEVIKSANNSREFVLKHNDSLVVAQRSLDFWMEHI